MNYKEYIPSNKLYSIVDAMWVATNSNQEIESRILPDGCVDIIFNLDKETCISSKNEIRISGMMTRFRNVVSKKNSEYLGIRFKTGQFNTISNIPLSEIKNETINASDLFPMLKDSFLEELILKNNHLEKIQLVSDFLMNEINWSYTEFNLLELSVCKSIGSNFQDIDFTKIAKEHFISLRQLERRFKAIIGVTMKDYHSIIRFKNTIHSISTNPNTSLLNIAFDNGYFDHSHLTKDIYRMSGQNPSEL